MNGGGAEGVWVEVVDTSPNSTTLADTLAHRPTAPTPQQQRLSFFDKHTTAQLTALISVELDAVRSFIFK